MSLSSVCRDHGNDNRPFCPVCVAELEQKLVDAHLQLDEARKLMEDMITAASVEDWLDACTGILEEMAKFVNRDTKA